MLLRSGTVLVWAGKMKTQLQLLLAFFSILQSNGARLQDNIKQIETGSKEWSLDDILGLTFERTNRNANSLSAIIIQVAGSMIALSDSGSDWRRTVVHGVREKRPIYSKGLLQRRFLDHYEDEGTILGSPTSIHHLPEAEQILPGHTLLRPALGMLKSAVKFPHKDMVDGSGVYGNVNNIGMTWDGTNERLVYTKFRRNNPDDLALVILPQSREMRYQDAPELL